MEYIKQFCVGIFTLFIVLVIAGFITYLFGSAIVALGYVIQPSDVSSFVWWFVPGCIIDFCILIYVIYKLGE